MAFDDAMRLYAKNDGINDHYAPKLAELVKRGAEKIWPFAGRGQVDWSQMLYKGQHLP